MEKFPQKKNNSERIKNVAKSAMAGAVFFGAVSAADTAAHADSFTDRFGASTKIEAHQNNFEHTEAEAFLDEVADMDEGFGDARSKHMMNAQIEAKLNMFSLALEQHVPVFSSGGKSHVSGAVTLDSRTRAAKILIPMLQASADKDSFGLQILKQILAPASTPNHQKTPANNPDQTQSDIHQQGDMFQPSEVKRTRNKDW